MIERAELLRVQRLDPGLGEEPTRWVYYPWRRTLTSVLGPKGFRTLRLDRNRNKITRAEQDRFAQARIGIVGLSVGHVIAHTLALEGLCGELRLTDSDHVELSNLNRIPATVLDLGVNKAVVAARRIAELDPYLVVTVTPGGLHPDNIDDFFDGLDLVVEECDSLDMKLIVREVAGSRTIRVIMEMSAIVAYWTSSGSIPEPSHPLFHGLLPDITAVDLASLTTRDKVPYVLAILEPDHLSARMAASMAEINYSLSTWPQLGEDVTLGAATVGATIRRLLRGDPVTSGRTRVDLDAVVDGLRSPAPPAPDLAESDSVRPRPTSRPGRGSGARRRTSALRGQRPALVLRDWPWPVLDPLSSRADILDGCSVPGELCCYRRGVSQRPGGRSEPGHPGQVAHLRS